jgi:peptidoglycan/LPS O-acetylase OafA/YrhL
MSLPISLSKSEGRLLTVDALRGLAALSITFAHVSGNVMISFEQIRDSWLNVISFPFSVGVARVYMFFLISGFCIHLAWCKSKSARSVKRTRRTVFTILETPVMASLSNLPDRVRSLFPRRLRFGKNRFRPHVPSGSLPIRSI